MKNRKVYTSSTGAKNGPLSEQATYCTVSYASGVSCERPPIEGGPVSVCFKHAMEIYNFLAAELAAIPDATADAILAEPETMRLPAWRSDLPTGEHVYYIEVDGLVKIGYTSNLKQRLRDYPPSSVLLGIEPGDRNLERQRHAQFSHYLKLGREWHSRGDGILRHVRQLNGNSGTPVQLGLFPKAA